MAKKASKTRKAPAKKASSKAMQKAKEIGKPKKTRVTVTLEYDPIGRDFRVIKWG
jgi:hypothetical protein